MGKRTDGGMDGGADEGTDDGTDGGTDLQSLLQSCDYATKTILKWFNDGLYCAVTSLIFSFFVVFHNYEHSVNLFINKLLSPVFPSLNIHHNC